MKKYVWLTFALLSSAGTASALPAGNCVLTSKADLQGDTVALTVSATSAVEKLAFTPASAYVAKGYALKLFTAPSFRGTGTMLGSSDYGNKATTGGTYINLPRADDLLSPIASAACVTEGVPFPDGNYTNGDLYYNDRTFAISGYRSNGLSVNVTYTNGKKLVQFYAGGSSSEGPQPPTIGTFDFDTGEIDLTANGVTQTFPHAWTLEYAGAAAVLANSIDSIISNEGNWPPSPQAPVPFLELQPIVRQLRSVASFGLIK